MNKINGVRNLYTELTYNSVYSNNVLPLLITNLYGSVPRRNSVSQEFSKWLQSASEGNNAVTNCTFNRSFANIDVVIQKHICDPSIEKNKTLQLDSVLRKRRKKMKKHKLRKRRKRERALKRKISQGQKK